MSDKYILREHEPIKADLLTWAGWMESGDRKVAKTKIDKEVNVSTVFLGLDHQWGEGPPLIFETMIFGGEWDGYQWRYSTWGEAELGHERIVECLQSGVSPE